MVDDSTTKKKISKQVRKNPEIQNVPEDIAEIKIETEQKDIKDAKIEELTNALARAMADLQNFRRRTEEDQFKFIILTEARRTCRKILKTTTGQRALCVSTKIF
jgi:molecular chaperone GrpE (heat shock protein)